MGLVTVPKGPTRGPEYTAADLSGVGTTILSSAVMVVDYSVLPPLAGPPVLEVKFTQVLSEGAGTCNAWVLISGLTMYATVAANAAAPEFRSGYVQAVGSARARTLQFRLPNLHTVSGYASNDYVRVQVQAAGSAADSGVSVTGITARLIYTPL